MCDCRLLLPVLARRCLISMMIISCHALVVVHIFGATSSPGCANFALQPCARDNAGKFKTETITTVLTNFYVDDCLKSVECEEEALTLAKDLTSLCATGGFKLNKWVSNSRALILSIPEEDRAKEVKDLDFKQDSLRVERALGVQWCLETDTFRFKIQLPEKNAHSAWDSISSELCL